MSAVRESLNVHTLEATEPERTPVATEQHATLTSTELMTPSQTIDDVRW